MPARSTTRRRLFGLAIAIAISAALLAVLFFAGRVWWEALRGSSPSPPADGQPAEERAGVALVGTASIHLAWDQSPDPKVTGYRVKYGTQRGVYTGSVTVGAQASATLTNLRNATTYYIVAVALDANGNESPPSNELEVRTAD